MFSSLDTLRPFDIGTMRDANDSQLSDLSDASHQIQKHPRTLQGESVSDSILDYFTDQESYSSGFSNLNDHNAPMMPPGMILGTSNMPYSSTNNLDLGIGFGRPLENNLNNDMGSLGMNSLGTDTTTLASLGGFSDMPIGRPRSWDNLQLSAHGTLNSRETSPYTLKEDNVWRMNDGQQQLKNQPMQQQLQEDVNRRVKQQQHFQAQQQVAQHYDRQARVYNDRVQQQHLQGNQLGPSPTLNNMNNMYKQQVPLAPHTNHGPPGLQNQQQGRLSTLQGPGHGFVHQHGTMGLARDRVPKRQNSPPNSNMSIISDDSLIHLVCSMSVLVLKSVDPNKPGASRRAAEKTLKNVRDILGCYDVPLTGAVLKAVELANTLRGKLGTSALAHARIRFGGLLSVLEMRPDIFCVCRIPRSDFVTLVGTARQLEAHAFSRGLTLNTNQSQHHHQQTNHQMNQQMPPVQSKDHIFSIDEHTSTSGHSSPESIRNQMLQGNSGVSMSANNTHVNINTTEPSYPMPMSTLNFESKVGIEPQELTMNLDLSLNLDHLDL